MLMDVTVHIVTINANGHHWLHWSWSVYVSRVFQSFITPQFIVFGSWLAILVNHCVQMWYFRIAYNRWFASLRFREFGSKVIPIKPMVKQIQRLLEDRDKTVRDEGKLLVVEIYRWIGAALKPQLASLKPVQVCNCLIELC